MAATAEDVSMSVPTGAIDFHVHAAPSYFGRKLDAIELAEHASADGLGGVVLKSHFGNTHAMAGLATDRVADVTAYHAVVLNSFVGGFNPTAVEYALETGAAVVWFPTLSAKAFEFESVLDRPYPFSNQSLTVLDDDGEIRPSVVTLLETIRDAPREIAIGNGHLSRAETFALMDEIERLGLTSPLLVTHPDYDWTGLSVADQIELADRGAIIEKCYIPVVHGDVTVQDIVDSIDEIGPARCLLSTDHGQPSNPAPSAAYATYCEELSEHGISDAELEQLAVTTPQSILPEMAA